MRILIKPNDVLLFRESRSFTAGEHHLARSVFPLPQTISGAIRSRILINSNFSAEDFVGYKKDEPKFEILGHFLFKEQEFFATPFDIAKAKEIDGYFFVEPLRLWTGKFIFRGKHIHFSSIGGYLSYENLTRYLRGDLREKELEDVIEKDDKLVKGESRVGIKLNEAKATEEGYFYKVEFLRLGQLSVWLGDRADEVRKYIGNRGFLKLGGENRFATFDVEDVNPLSDLENAWNEIKKEINKTQKFKLYVATPLLIGSNGKYTWNPKNSLENRLNITIKGIYPLIGKPITFSGWSYANKSPKPNRYAIPAGSIYFVEFEGEIKCDKPYLKLGELTKLGYGLCFMGVWKDEQSLSRTVGKPVWMERSNIRLQGR